MVVPYGIDTDFLLLDGLESVTVYSAVSDGGTPTAQANGVRALKMPVTVAPRLIGDGGEIPEQRCRWHLYAADISFLASVKKRDRIVQASNVQWVILSFQRQVFESALACECVRV